MKTILLFAIGFGILNLSIFAGVIPDKVLNRNLAGYTQREIGLIEIDLENIKAHSLLNCREQKERFYIATAGGPGSAKSTILEGSISRGSNKAVCYVDPDRVSMRSMINTYVPFISFGRLGDGVPYDTLLREGYSKWRGASNYISNSILNEAVEYGYTVVHGTTSTSPKIESLYQNLKARGYRIALFLCGASDETRKELLRRREQSMKIVQVCQEDVMRKGQMFNDRLDVYFASADYVHVFWTELRNGEVETDMVAYYDQEDGLQVIDRKGLAKFEMTHGFIPR